MPYLIDGNNLIGLISSFGQNDPRSRWELLGKLWSFQNVTRSRLWIVFDGPVDFDLVTQGRRWPKFRILFPEIGQKADELISNILKRSSQPRTITLVTSDQELKTLGRLKGVKTITSQEFCRKLKKILREAKKERQLEKPAFHLSPLETKLWLETLTRK